MQKFKNGAELIRAAAQAVRNADPKYLTDGTFVSMTGCLCAAGQVVYNDSPQIKKAVDALRQLVEVDMFDEDLLEIMAMRIDTEANIHWDDMVGNIHAAETIPLFTRFDASWSLYRSTEAAATSLENLIYA